MVAKLRRFITLSFVAATLCLGAGQSVWAAPYGTNNYSECTYQGDCTGSSPATSPAASSAPNTGLQRESLWFVVAGILGVSLISFVGIRYLNIAKPKK